MRLLRATASTLARLLADLLLILALLTTLLWLATRSHPLSLDHNATAPAGENWHASLRLVASRGGLWILHLTTRPPGAPVPLGLGPPHYWTLLSRDAFDPDARLSLQQTGPRRLGFSSRLREDPRRAYAYDGRARRPVEQSLTERERITRIPFAAVVAALLVAPTIRIARAARRRVRAARDRDPAPAPRAFPIARRLFDLAALASALLLGFAVAQWITARQGENFLSWTTRWSQGSSYEDVSVRRQVLWSASGWEFSRVSFDGTVSRISTIAAGLRGATPPPPLDDDPHSHILGLNLRDDLLFRSYSAGYAAVGGASGHVGHLGFHYNWEDLPIGRVGLTYPLVRVRPTLPGAPPTYGMQTATQPVQVPPTVATARRTAASLLIPHWGALLLSALLPSLWLLRFRRPLRQHLRRRRGLCPTCGYDLRATPTACPECGATPASQPRSGDRM